MSLGLLNTNICDLLLSNVFFRDPWKPFKGDGSLFVSNGKFAGRWEGGMFIIGPLTQMIKYDNAPLVRLHCDLYFVSSHCLPLLSSYVSACVPLRPASLCTGLPVVSRGTKTAISILSGQVSPSVSVHPSSPPQSVGLSQCPRHLSLSLFAHLPPPPRPPNSSELAVCLELRFGPSQWRRSGGITAGVFLLKPSPDVCVQVQTDSVTFGGSPASKIWQIHFSNAAVFDQI